MKALQFWVTNWMVSSLPKVQKGFVFYIYQCVCVCVRLYVCVCVCVCTQQKEAEREDKTRACLRAPGIHTKGPYGYYTVNVHISRNTRFVIVTAYIYIQVTTQ